MNYKNSAELYNVCINIIEKEIQRQKDAQAKRDQYYEQRRTRAELKEKALKTAKIIGITILIVAIAVSIFSIVSCTRNKIEADKANKEAHNISNINIQIINKNSYYDENEGLYGAYKIVFTYKIANNTKAKINYIAFTVHFIKNNKEIASVQSSFGSGGQESALSLKLSSGSSVTKNSTITCYYNQYSSDTAFQYLYTTPLENMNMTFEITSVDFADGQYYYVSPY